MSAECHVEGLPLSGADISIDGLRLRLDIRIVPRSKGDIASGDPGAMFRVVSAKIAATSQIPTYQWAAMMVGLGVLVVALVLWFAAPARGPLASESTPASLGATSTPASAAPPKPGPIDKIAASPPSSSALVGVESPAAPATTAASAPVLAAPLPAPAHVPPVDAATSPPTRRAEPKKPAPTPAPVRPMVAAAASPPHADSSVASYNPQPVAQRRAVRDDMLDLFGDTK